MLWIGLFKFPGSTLSSSRSLKRSLLLHAAMSPLIPDLAPEAVGFCRGSDFIATISHGTEICLSVLRNFRMVYIQVTRPLLSFTSNSMRQCWKRGDMSPMVVCTMYTLWQSTVFQSAHNVSRALKTYEIRSECTRISLCHRTGTLQMLPDPSLNNVGYRVFLIFRRIPCALQHDLHGSRYKGSLKPLCVAN